jgi:hypothetical protein
MGNWINKQHPVVIVDHLDPEQLGAAVVTAEPPVGTPGLVVYNDNGYADNPIRTDTTGTTVQPVSIVSGGGTNTSVGPTGSPVPSNATFVGGKDPGGNLAGFKIDGSGALVVTTGAGSSYANGSTPTPPITGPAVLGVDTGTGTVHVIKTDSTGAVFVTGSISATNPSVGTDGAASPSSSTQIGVSDGANLQAVRTPSVFKHIATDGTSAPRPIWTPASGKKFRLMRIQVQVSANAYITAGAMLNLYFSEGLAGADIGFDFNIWIPPSMGTNTGGGIGNNYLVAPVYDSPFIDLGNGYLAAAANTTLYVQLNQVLTAGLITVNVMGTEE